MRLSLLFSLLLPAAFSFAQSVPVTGTLTQASDGAPLPFATVIAFSPVNSIPYINATPKIAATEK